MTTTAYLVDHSFDRSVVVDGLPGDPQIRALFYGDGRVGIEHRCKVVGDTQIICAPVLQFDAGHHIVSEDPLTVTPSIACGDCGLHGFIRDGRWVPAG